MRGFFTSFKLKTQGGLTPQEGPRGPLHHPLFPKWMPHWPKAVPGGPGRSSGAWPMAQAAWRSHGQGSLGTHSPRGLTNPARGAWNRKVSLTVAPCPAFLFLKRATGCCREETTGAHEPGPAPCEVGAVGQAAGSPLCRPSPEAARVRGICPRREGRSSWHCGQGGCKLVSRPGGGRPHRHLVTFTGTGQEIAEEISKALSPARRTVGSFDYRWEDCPEGILT